MKPSRDTPKLSKSKSAALTPFDVCSTSQFLTHGGSSPDTLVNANKRNNQPLLHQLAALRQVRCRMLGVAIIGRAEVFTIKPRKKFRVWTQEEFREILHHRIYRIIT